jgi:hypothetical protein
MLMIVSLMQVIHLLNVNGTRAPRKQKGHGLTVPFSVKKLMQGAARHPADELNQNNCWLYFK